MPFEISLENQDVQHILFSVAVLLTSWLVSYVAKKIVRRSVTEVPVRYRATKRVNRILALISFLLIIAIWSPSIKTLLAGLTIIGTGLAIALREVVLSFIGWVYIVIRKPFEVGDRIEINGVAGDVIDIQMLTISLMEIRGWVQADQSTGRMMRIPNNWVFQFPTNNFTGGFSHIWNELSFLFTFDTNWEKAKEILTDLAAETAPIVEQQVKSQLHALSQEYMIHYSILTPFVYVKVTDFGIQLTLRYLCNARNRRGSEHAFTTSILEAFSEHADIKLTTKNLFVR